MDTFFESHYLFDRFFRRLAVFFDLRNAMDVSFEKRAFGSLRKCYRAYYRRLTPDRVWAKAWPLIESQLQKR